VNARGLAIRRVEQSLGLCAAVVLTLSLCFGANSLLFAVIDGALLEPPSGEAERIVARTLVPLDSKHRASASDPSFADLEVRPPTRPFRRYAPLHKLHHDTASEVSGRDVARRPVWRASGRRPGYKGART
jgi:hypothetical protein